MTVCLLLGAMSSELTLVYCHLDLREQTWNFNGDWNSFIQQMHLKLSSAMTDIVNRGMSNMTFVKTASDQCWLSNTANFNTFLTSVSNNANNWPHFHRLFCLLKYKFIIADIRSSRCAQPCHAPSLLVINGDTIKIQMLSMTNKRYIGRI